MIVGCWLFLLFQRGCVCVQRECYRVVSSGREGRTGVGITGMYVLCLCHAVTLCCVVPHMRMSHTHFLSHSLCLPRSSLTLPHSSSLFLTRPACVLPPQHRLLRWTSWTCFPPGGATMAALNHCCRRHCCLCRQPPGCHVQPPSSDYVVGRKAQRNTGVGGSSRGGQTSRALAVPVCGTGRGCRGRVVSCGGGATLCVFDPTA